jgi:hypothetical protein
MARIFERFSLLVLLKPVWILGSLTPFLPKTVDLVTPI